jgi:transposase
MANMTQGGRGRRPRRRFSDEFKAGAVRLVLEDKRPVRRVARELNIVPSGLARWVELEKERLGLAPPRPTTPSVLTTDERAELDQLRKRVRELEVDKAILKKAAAFFAKENA